MDRERRTVAGIGIPACATLVPVSEASYVAGTELVVDGGFLAQ